MPLEIDLEGWTGGGPLALPAFGLVLARVVGLVWPLTCWGAATLEARARLIVAFVVAVVVAPAVAPAAVDAAPAALALSALGELARGAALGLMAALVVGAACQAGELVGAAAGLTPMFDPGPGGGGDPDEPLTPTGSLYLVTALAAFLAMDGPLALISALIDSYRTLPPGLLFEDLGSGTGREAARAASRAIGGSIGLALRLAAPLALPVVAAQVVLGLVTRFAPVPPWSALAWPLRVVLTVVLAMFVLAATFAALRSSWAGTRFGG